MGDLGPVGSAYARCRQRLVDLARSTTEAREQAVPACPGWSVHDVVAHCAGVVDDVLAGRLEGVATDAWTEAQVAPRRDLGLDDVVAAWEEQAPGFEALLDGIGPSGRQAVADVVTHEHDVRGALGRPGARTSDAVLVGLDFLVPAYLSGVRARGGSLHVRAGDRSWGADDASVVLEVEPFELLRATTGRRSEAQLRSLPWRGDAGPLLAAFTYGPFVPRPDALQE